VQPTKTIKPKTRPIETWGARITIVQVREEVNKLNKNNTQWHRGMGK